MLKILGGVVVGVFVGALALEILSRSRPDLIRGIEERAEKTANAFIDAFSEGYTNNPEEGVD